MTYNVFGGTLNLAQSNPVKNWVVGCWRGYLSGVRCRFAYAHQMPLPVTVSCSSKSRLVLTFLVLPFWYLLTRVVPDIFQKSSKTVVCVNSVSRASISAADITSHLISSNLTLNLKVLPTPHLNQLSDREATQFAMTVTNQDGLIWRWTQFRLNVVSWDEVR